MPTIGHDVEVYVPRPAQVQRARIVQAVIVQEREPEFSFGDWLERYPVRAYLLLMSPFAATALIIFFLTEVFPG